MARKAFAFLCFSEIPIQSMGGPISFLFFCFPYLVVAALCLDVCLNGVESKSTSWRTNPNTSTPFHTQTMSQPAAKGRRRRDARHGSGDDAARSEGKRRRGSGRADGDGVAPGKGMATALERKMATAWCLSRRRRQRLAGRVVGPNKVGTR